MSTPRGATPLGRHFYLFKSKTNSTDCIISAHGGYISEIFAFDVPRGVTLRFYSPHSSTLIDPGLGSFQRKESRALAIEILHGGERCKNYRLQKYQGHHGNENETYESIANGVLQQDLVRGSMFGKLMRAKHDPNSTPDYLQNLLIDLGRQYGGSVLTVRNRWDAKLGVSLSDAIDAARTEMPTIRNFFCLFCRANMLGEDEHQPGQIQYAT
jgi:hypothetical protein